MRPISALAVFSLVCGACLDQSLPPGVTIRCDPEDDSTCPSGTKCQPGLLVCVEEKDLDDTAPTLTLTAEPPVASRAQPLSLRVVASEPLDNEPSAVLVLADGEQALDFIARDSNPSAQDYRFSYAPTGVEPEGEALVVRVSAEDRVGLRGEAEVEVQFDFTPPLVPPTDSAVDPLGAVVLVVAPAGTREDSEPVWRVEAPIGSMEAGAKLTLRASPTTVPFDEANARVDGSARVDVPVGLSSIWVGQRDEAGNESEIVRLREVRLIASTTPFDFEGVKLASTFSPRADAGPLAQGRVKPPYPGFELRGPMSVVRGSVSVPALYEPSITWDAARGELLLVSGQPANDVDTVGTYVWNGVGWAPRTWNAPQRAGAVAVANPLDGSILLFGGSYTSFSGSFIYESSRFDGVAFAEDEAEISDYDEDRLHRLLCTRFQAAYDPSRPGTLVVHGCDAYLEAGEEFSQWDRTPDGVWHFITVPPDPEGDGNPRTVSGACMAADPVRQVLVLFGGGLDDDSGTYFGDTWEWNGVSWRRAASADPSGQSAPTPRNGPFCAADPVTGHVYLGGGYSDFNVNENAREELWRWDGASWTQLADLPRTSDYGAVAGFDERARELIVFLQPSSGEAQPTLAFDGASWRVEGGLPIAPGPREEPSLASHTDGLYLWGGYGVDELWRYDGAWSAVGTLAAENRPDAVLVSRNDELLLIGGYNVGGDTVMRIELDQQAEPGAEIPTTAIAGLPEDATRWTNFALAVHPDTGVVGVVGGYRTSALGENVAETYSWFLDGTTWTRGPLVANAPDLDFYSPSLVWDAAADAFVLYGVYFDSDRRAAWMPFSGMASLASASWEFLDAPLEPPGTDSGAFVFDPALGASILIGGYGHDSTDGSIDQLSVWRGNDWVTVPIVDAEGDGALPAIAQGAGVLDPESGRVLLYGGQNQSSVASTRTYFVDTLADEKPALMVDVDPLVGGFEDVVALRSLTLFVRAGASGRDTGAGPDGVDVRVWQGTRWLTVGSVDGSAAAPQEVTIEVPAEATARAMFAGTVPVQLVPRGENGADRARLSVPLVEATAVFRLRE